MTTIGSLFSGIGGLERGLEIAVGARTVWQVEADPFCRRVLARHWPHAERFDDVRTVRSLPTVGIMCGGFPCQDVSLAGKGAGIDGERSGLWREFARIIGESRPRVVVIENVAALAGRGLNRVIGDLARLGYMGSWNVVSAAAVGAPHLRRRIFIIAADADRCVVWDRAEWHARWCDALQRTRESISRHARENRTSPNASSRRLHGSREGEVELARGTEAVGDGLHGPLADTNSQPADEWRAHHRGEGTRGRDADRGTVGETSPDAESSGRRERRTDDATGDEERRVIAGCSPSWCGWLAPSPVRGVDARSTGGMDRPRRGRPAADKHRLKALGNAVVPQCAMVAGHVVKSLIESTRGPG